MLSMMQVRPYFKSNDDQLNFQKLLQSDRRIELEVGSGKGLFLIEAAANHPETYFVGIELADKYAKLAQKRLEERSISNARFFSANAVEVICRDVPDERLAAVHVYFPDPWWKARHKKRRVLNERMVIGIERVLQPGGYLHFWTDVLDYFESSVELIAASTQLTGPEFVEERSAEHSMDYHTHFERRTRLNNLPVYRSLFRKQFGR
jgi:tRNA (guanine-N7-)-methyltransferase